VKWVVLFLREVAWKMSVSMRGSSEGQRRRFYPPTLEVASVKLFNVVLLPDEGLPTRPMRGSRGILGCVELLKFLH
jgi:hypothetical protein